MPEWLTFLLAALLGFLGLVVTALVTFFTTRGKTRADVKTTLAQTKATIDARIDLRVAQELEGAWGRLDTLEREFGEFRSTHTRKMAAVARVLRAIARQWHDTTGPDLEPSDISEIEDTIPAHWIRKPKENP